MTKMLTYFHPKKVHSVEVREDQDVQRRALERSGYQLVREPGEDGQEGILALAIGALEQELQAVDNVAELQLLYSEEEAGQRRKGALAAIVNRIQELE